MTTAPVQRTRSLRRSKLLAKGGTWEAIAAANAASADVIQIELESGFAEDDRSSAVEATCRALAELEWSKKEAWVRFRHVERSGTREELARVIAHRPHLVYCAKVKSAQDILLLDALVSECEAASGIEPGTTQIGAVIERVEALASVEAIAAASPRMGALMFGANDMSLDFGYRRSGVLGDNPETLFIRSRMILAARLARIDVFDAAWPKANDLEESEADAHFSAQMGFTGKTAMTPGQTSGIHRAFRPSPRETTWALEVMAASAHDDPAQKLVDGDIVDARDVEQAWRLLARSENHAAARA